ncbi:MAG: hypothetical protein ABI389_07830 [Rhodanobacter sp.]
MSGALAKLQTAVAAGNRLGEDVRWCERAQSLFWTGIEAATL